MNKIYKILIFGASYGSLLGTKLALAGHSVKLLCRPATAALINAEGVRVRMPVKGQEEGIEIDSRKAPGKLTADSPAAINPLEYDLAVLAMQEPQYSAPGVRELLIAVAKAQVPCVSIMNIPPLPYLARIPGISVDRCRDCYTDPGVWDEFDPALMTLCSPDPQAVRPPQEKGNVLQVRLATNFKAARFESDSYTAMLKQLDSEIEAIRFDTGQSKIELPVKLKVYDSIFVPLAKWSMLLAGNYRCIDKNGMQSIKQTVHDDIETSRKVYSWVTALCESLGASGRDLVPFEKYANAALSLINPSSVARSLANGATAIERTDRLVKILAKQRNMQCAIVDHTVALVDHWLECNRGAQRV